VDGRERGQLLDSASFAYRFFANSRREGNVALAAFSFEEQNDGI
jgi:hypothetical protein